MATASRTGHLGYREQPEHVLDCPLLGGLWLGETTELNHVQLINRRLCLR